MHMESVNPDYDEWFRAYERKKRSDALHSNAGLKKLFDVAGIKARLKWTDFEELDKKRKDHSVFPVIAALRDYHQRLVREMGLYNPTNEVVHGTVGVGEVVDGSKLPVAIIITESPKKQSLKKAMRALEIAIKVDYYAYLDELDEEEDEDVIGPYLKANGFNLPIEDAQ